MPCVSLTSTLLRDRQDVISDLVELHWESIRGGVQLDDGVHLGKEDGNLMAARAMLGPTGILGASCYADFAAAQVADAAGVDYVAFGAVYPSPTKPDATLAPKDLFFDAKIRLTAASCAIGGISLENAQPLIAAKTGLAASCCAIGGITLDNAPTLIAAGADLLAVISDLFNAPDITARAAAYQHLFEEPRA